jgi:hypothetical protein
LLSIVVGQVDWSLQERCNSVTNKQCCCDAQNLPLEQQGYGERLFSCGNGEKNGSFPRPMAWWLLGASFVNLTV